MTKQEQKQTQRTREIDLVSLVCHSRINTPFLKTLVNLFMKDKRFQEYHPFIQEYKMKQKPEEAKLRDLHELITTLPQAYEKPEQDIYKFEIEYKQKPLIVRIHDAPFLLEEQEQRATEIAVRTIEEQKPSALMICPAFLDLHQGKNITYLKKALKYIPNLDESCSRHYELDEIMGAIDK